MTRKHMIGIDRPVRLEWLDAAAAQLVSGASERDTREHLWKLLEGVVAGDTPQSARGKTMTVISRVWITVPESSRSLRARALERIEDASPDERIATHWALMSAAYPFFVDLATILGKMLRLHGSITLVQVLRRMTESWGDRSTLRPAVQRIIRMMIGWGVLLEGAGKGELRPADHRLKISAPFAELLFEGALLSSAASISLSDLRSHPSFFAYDVSATATDLRNAKQFELHREGSELDVVALR